MRGLIREIAGKGLKREDVRAARRSRPSQETVELGEAEPKPYVFRYELPEVNAKLELRFEKPSPAKGEIVGALKRVLEALEGD